MSLLAFTAVLAGSVYLALPWLVVQLLPGIAVNYGIQVHQVEIRRPDPGGIAIVRFEASSGEVRVKVSNAYLSYRPSALLAGELDTLTASQALLTLAADTTDTAAEPGKNDSAAFVPNAAALFAAIPFSAVEISQFTVEVPEVGFVGTGDVRYRDQQIEFAIYGIDPEPAQLLVARGRLDAGGLISLELAEFEPETRVFLATESVLKDTQLAVSATIDLSGYPYQLVRSLLLLPAGDGEVRGELHSVVALPLDAESLARLDAQGSFTLDWRSADGKLALRGLEAAGHLRSETVQARFSQGTIEYVDEPVSAQLRLEPGTTLTWSGERIVAGAGVSLELATNGFKASGVSDVLTLDLKPDPAMRGAATLDLVTEPGSLSGTLAWQAQLQGSEVIRGAGSWLSAEQELPFQFRHAISDGVGELTSAATLQISQPLAGSLLKDWVEDYDLVAGELGYDLSLHWSDNYGGRLALLLNEVDARYGEDVLYGVSGQPILEIESTGLSMQPARLHAGHVDPGVLLTDLEARIGVAGDQLSIQQASFSVFGGRAEVTDFDYDLAESNAAFNVDLKSIDLTQLLALEGDDIQGDGVLDGYLPVQINAGVPSISGGRLESQPPGGSIRLAPDFGALTGQPGLDFAVKALTDYRYSSLTASVDYHEDGELQLGVSLQGRNPEVEKGRPIHYNLNVTENVLVLLESLRAQRTVTEGIERRALQQR